MNKPYVLAGFIGLAFLSNVSTITADEIKENYTYLPKVLVTPTAMADYKDSNLDTVQVYFTDELNMLGVETLQEAINLFAGASISNSGGVNSIFVRGMSSGQVKVFIDGIELKDAMSTNGASYTGSVVIDDIEQIEFVTGAKSTLYGSDALAGVIHVITKKVDGVLVNANAGYKQNNISISAGTNVNGFDLSTSISSYYNDSISQLSNTEETDASDLKNINISVGKKLGGITSTLSFRKQLQAQDLDSSFSKIDDPNFTSNSDQNLVSLTLEGAIGKAVESKLFISQANLERNTENKTDSVDSINTEDTRYSSQVEKVEIRNNAYLNDYLSLSFGGEAKRESGSYKDKRNYGFGDSTDEVKEKTQDTVGVYAGEQFRYKGFIVDVSGRIERYNSSKTVNTYSFGVGQYIPVLNIMAKYSYKTGFRQATLYERFNTYSGVDNLKAETSQSREFTLEKNIDFITVYGSYFEYDVANLITIVSQYSEDNLTYASDYLNSEQLMQSYGGEFGVGLKPYKNLQFLNLTWTKTHSKTGGFENLKVPKQKLTAALGLQMGKYSVGSSLIHVGNQRASTSKNLDPYTVVNASVSYAVNLNSSVYVLINNLTNTQYEAVRDFQTQDRNLRLGYKKQF